jgi:hypothetical protein
MIRAYGGDHHHDRGRDSCSGRKDAPGDPHLKSKFASYPCIVRIGRPQVAVLNGDDSSLYLGL